MFEELTKDFPWEALSVSMQCDLAECMDHFMEIARNAVVSAREVTSTGWGDDSSEEESPASKEDEDEGQEGQETPTEGVNVPPLNSSLNSVQDATSGGQNMALMGLVVQLMQQQNAASESGQIRRTLEMLPRYVEGGKTDVYTFTDLVRQQTRHLAGTDLTKIAAIMQKLGDEEREQVLANGANTGTVEELLVFLEGTFDVHSPETLREQTRTMKWKEGPFMETFKKLASLHAKAVRREVPLLRRLEELTISLLSQRQERELMREYPSFAHLPAKEMARIIDERFEAKVFKGSQGDHEHKSSNERRTTRSSPAPRRELKCFSCGEPGHFKKDCPRKESHQVAAIGSNVLMNEVRVNGIPSMAVIDTGAEVSLMTLSKAERVLGKNQIKPFSGTLKGIGGSGPREINQISSPLQVTLEGETREIQFWIVDDIEGDWEGHDTYIGFEALRGRSVEELTEWASRREEKPTPVAWRSVVNAPGEGLRKANLDPSEMPRLGMKENPVPYQAPGVRVPEKFREPLRLELQKLTEEEVIEEIEEDEWAARPVVVLKDIGPPMKIRLTVDFRWVNDQCTSKIYLARTIRDIVQTMAKNVWFTRLDLKSGYHQLPLHPEDRKFTGFRTPFGLYRYKRLPQGVKNAPPIFQRIMEKTLSGLSIDNVAVYLDDIVMGASSIQELESLEEEVIRRLADKNLQLNADKSERNVQETKLLGWKIRYNSVAPPEERMESIRDWPSPRTRGELQRFLGAVGFFRSCVPGMAPLAAPLYRKLSKEGGPFPLTDEEEDAIEHLKNAVQDSGINAPGGDDFETHLVTDASASGMGAALLHIHPITEEIRVLGFWSHHLSPAERNYAATKLELMGIVRAMEHFEDLIVADEVVVHTDHKPLLGLIWAKDPPAVIWRWLERLFSFRFQLRHISGRDNALADFLSRLPLTGEVAAISAIAWEEEQSKDSKVAALARFLKLGETPSSRPEKWIVQRRPKGLEMVGNIVCVNGRNYVPDHLAEEIIRGEIGEATTIQEVRKRVEGKYYLPQLQRRVAQVIRREKPEMVNTPASYKRKEEQLAEEAPAMEDEEDEKEDEEDKEEEEVKPMPGWTIEPTARDTYVRLQAEDPICRSWNQKGQGEEIPNGLTRIDGVWFKNGKLFVPERGVEEEMRKIHERGHLAAAKMVGIFKAAMEGPTPWKWARKTMRNCPICTRLRKSEQEAVGMATPTYGPTQVVHVDFFGPVALTRNGNKYALVIVDVFSGYVEAYPLSNQDTSAAIYGLTQWVTRYGTPRILVSDQGAGFIAEAFRHVLKLFKVDHRMSSAFHPQGNGVVEVRNRILKKILTRLTNAGVEDWDLALPWALAAVNSSPHMRHGFTPHFILYGRNFHYPDEVLWEEEITIDGHAASIIRVHDQVQRIVFESIEEGRKERSKQPTESFEVGEWIWAKDPSSQESRSFGSEWNGPFQVVERVSELLYKVHRRGRDIIYNVNSLRRQGKQEITAVQKREKKRLPSKKEAKKTRKARSRRAKKGTYREAKI